MQKVQKKISVHRREIKADHRRRKAPEILSKSEKTEETKMKKFVCSVCGYVYEG
ncbi:MAG: 50S ribosomal protein L32, partial [Clostridia bacterium]|nr:50S ribosomal protein L32 [Clostridia bacterium]